MPKRPLVGIVGPLGPAQLACLRSWRRGGNRSVFFHIGMRPVPTAFRRIADHYRFFSSSADLNRTLQEIHSDCTRLKVDGITALAEQLALKLYALWSSAEHDQTELYLNAPAIYECLESKLAQAELASQAGLPVLPTIEITADSAAALDFSHPWVLRPDVARQVRPMFKARLINSREELHSFLGTMSGMGSSLVAQPFVAGPNVVIHGARAKDGRWDHHEAFITEIKSEGLAVSIRPHPLDTNLLSSCQRLERLLDIRGVFHFDFIVDQYSGDIFYLEVNPRLGGTTAKVYAAGYDEPSLLVSAFTEKSLPEMLLHTKRSPATSRIAAVRCTLAGLSHQPSQLDFPAGSGKRQAAKALKAIVAYRDDVFSLSDMVGNLAYLSQTGT